MSDAQVASEMFLVLINDLLASGEIPGLFPEDEMEEILTSMLNECKQMGIPDTRENAWTVFIDKVRKYLKVSLLSVWCFMEVKSYKSCSHLAVDIIKSCSKSKLMSHNIIMMLYCIFSPSFQFLSNPFVFFRYNISLCKSLFFYIYFLDLLIVF